MALSVVPSLQQGDDLYMASNTHYTPYMYIQLLYPDHSSPESAISWSLDRMKRMTRSTPSGSRIPPLVEGRIRSHLDAKARTPLTSLVVSLAGLPPTIGT